MCMISKGNSRDGNKNKQIKSGEGLLSWQKLKMFFRGVDFHLPSWQHLLQLLMKAFAKMCSGQSIHVEFKYNCAFLEMVIKQVFE